jgi:hypothetical protein
MFSLTGEPMNDKPSATEYATAIRKRLRIFESGLDEILQEQFGMRITEERSALRMVVLEVVAQVLGTYAEINAGNPHEVADHERAAAWLKPGKLSETRRTLLIFIAHAVTFINVSEMSLDQLEWANAAEMLGQVGHFHGLAMATAFELGRKRSHGEKGAKVRKIRTDEQAARALDIYRSLGIEHISPPQAAERARREGAPISYEKLVRLIRADRKRTKDSKPHADDTNTHTTDT